MRPVRVLVVDDSAFVRRAVKRMLSGAGEIDVVGTAKNGSDAIAKVDRLDPDVVLLDVEMPGMDGLEVLRRIMSKTPTRVVMMSAKTDESARTTLRALELGAVDFVDKSEAGGNMDIYALSPTLREAVLAAAGASVPAGEPVATAPSEVAEASPGQPIAPIPPLVVSAFDVVAIGASTGGPRALTELLARIPMDFPVGIVVAQHMPPGFTTTLAERLDRRSALSVAEAVDGDEVRPGRALIGPGGMQITVVRRRGTLRVDVDPGPSNLRHRPSVDLLFESVAAAAGNRAVGVILTGMGDDGARGIALLRRRGAPTIVESRETAIIYGMPRAAAGSAELVLPLPEIAPALLRIVRASTRCPETAD